MWWSWDLQIDNYYNYKISNHRNLHRYHCRNLKSHLMLQNCMISGNSWTKGHVKLKSNWKALYTLLPDLTSRSGFDNAHHVARTDKNRPAYTKLDRICNGMKLFQTSSFRQNDNLKMHITEILQILHEDVNGYNNMTQDKVIWQTLWTRLSTARNFLTGKI
jgi:hypothetical protein